VRVTRNWVPSAFTMANLFCGYFSVILTANGKFIQASWLIVAAAVLDALDGKIARLTKTASHFGVEYDSLADVVSFGFAPSFLIYKSVFQNWGTVGIIISFIPLVFGSVRLARFNIRLKGFDKEYFEGLPIPPAAITIATFLVFNYHFWGRLRWEKLYLLIVITVSVLMLTTIRYETLPNFSLQKGRMNRWKFFIIMISILTIILFPQETFFLWAVAYALSGPIRLSWQVMRGDEIERKKTRKNNESNNQSSAKKRNS